MADRFCKFLDFRSPSTGSCYRLHLLTPTTTSSSSIVRSFSSSVVSKIRRKPIFCKPASPAIDVISTHEHHDGSVLFRFGDPSEIVVLEEPTSVVDEEVKSVTDEESSVVEVLDVDDGNEVLIDKTEIEVTDELESVEESSVVEVLDVDNGSEVVIDKTKLEVTDELESVEESSVVEVLDVDNGSEVVIDKTEIEVTDELESVEESGVVEVLDVDNGSEVVIDKTEIEVSDEFASVEESYLVTDLDGDDGSEVVINKTDVEANVDYLIEVMEDLVADVSGTGAISSLGRSDDDTTYSESEPNYTEANDYGSSEVTDELDPDVSGTETIAVVERGDESSDSEGESSDSEDEMPVSTLNTEMEVSYNAGPDIESVTPDQEFLEDSSLSSVPVIDEVSEMESTMMTAALPENKTEEEIPLQKDSMDLDNVASQSSLETAVSTDKLVSSESQNVDVENEIIEDGNDASCLETLVADDSVNSELQSVDVELKNESTQDGTDNGASSLETLVADDSVNSELQSVDVELKNESTQDGKDNGASSLETFAAEDESVSSELHCGDAELNNETIEDITDNQSSLEAIITRDELINSELQNGKEIDITDLPMNLSEESQNSTEVSADFGLQNVEVEMKIEIVEDGMVSDSSEVLSDSSKMQVDVSLLDEAECDNVEDPVQSVAAGDESARITNYTVSGSPKLEEAVSLPEGAGPRTSENGMVIPNEIVEDEIVIDLMEPTSVSAMLETEPKLDEEMGERTVEEFKEDEIIGDYESKDDANVFVATSPESEEGLSAVVNPQTSQNGMGIMNETGQDEVESYVVKSTSVSPTFETESLFDKEMGEKSAGEDEFIGDDAIESEETLLMLESPEEQAESIKYAVTSNGALEEFQDDDRVENPTALNKVPEVLGTADDDYVQISHLPEALRDEVTHLGSMESASDRKEVMTDFVLSSGAALLPHPSKVLTGGEEAYFVAGQSWIGVADGIVQWSLEGAKPGVYAQELIRNCENLASSLTGNSVSYPLDLLKSSVAKTLSSGYSTVLIAQFDGQALHVANVGDSGFIILRHGTVYKRSSPMLHAFHFPLLFGKEDDPSHVSELYEVDLEEDDVIITATDGLFDNLYDQEISSVVMKSLAAELKLEDIASLLAKMAQDVGRSTSSRSPFADSAQAAGYVGYTGGKLDDVTVIVSVVKKRSSSQTA